MTRQKESLMKTLTVIIYLMLLANPAHAKDACATVLCMAGMLQGSGVVSNCSQPVEDYFSIVKFKHGGISWSRTFKARGKFLNQCSANNGWGNKINKAYGRVL